MSVTTIGFKEFEQKLKALPNEIKQEADVHAFDGIKHWQQLARENAPKDQSVLVRGITTQKLGFAHYEVVSAADYSGHIEWGTKSKRSVPADLKTYAENLPYTKSGDYYDFLGNILDWVKRKGIGMDTLKETNEVRIRFGQTRVTKKDRLLAVAERIAWSILKNGIKPHPYFFPPKPIIEKELLDDLNKLVSTEH